MAQDVIRDPARRQGGYTLIEMVMVVLILGIMLGLAFSRIEHLTPKYSMRAAARELARVASLARSRAAGQGRIHFVKYRIDENRYYILVPFEVAEVQSDEDDQTNAPPIPELRWEPALERELPEGIRFRDILVSGSEKVEEGDVTVEISPFGLTKGHVVHLTDGKQDYSIDVNPLTGHARFHEEYYEPGAAEEDQGQ